MTSPLVVIITLNWNRRDDTITCLDSLARVVYPNVRLLVVDNASTDGSPQAIAGRFPQVMQIANPANLGFAKGFNVGLHWALESGADFVLILNNDTFVAPDVLDKLITASATGDVGITAPCIYYASAPERIWSSGAQRSRLTLELSGNHGRGRPLDLVTERDFVSGCAMLIKRRVLETVGLFDERFFMYYEDSDYCLRVQRAGLRLLVVPDARLWHKVSSSSEGSNSPAERYWMGRSGVLFFRKHVRGWRWLAVFPWRIGSTIKTILNLWLSGRREAAQAYLHGVWEGMKAADE